MSDFFFVIMILLFLILPFAFYFDWEERKNKLMQTTLLAEIRLKECRAELDAVRSSHAMYITQNVEPRIMELEEENTKLREAAAGLREALIEIVNECECTELCTCSYTNKVTARDALAKFDAAMKGGE